ncbi:ash family protein [Salmonella enterica]|nr:ash family protein [Salmonella enterica]
MFNREQQKICLPAWSAGCYIFWAITVLMVGRENPVNTLATLSVLSAFFVVATIALAPFYGVVCHLLTVTVAGRGLLRITTGTSRRHVMVAQAGPLPGGPGSSVTGILTPVWAIASERENSSDSSYNYTLENCHHAQTPQKPYPKFGHPHYHSPAQLRLSSQDLPCAGVCLLVVRELLQIKIRTSTPFNPCTFLHPRRYRGHRRRVNFSWPVRRGDGKATAKT